jgi:hypothetical protein
MCRQPGQTQSASAVNDGTTRYADQIKVVLNWFEELKELAPVR